MSFIEEVRAAFPHAYCGYVDASDEPKGGRCAIYESIQDACRSDGKVVARGRSGSAAWRNAAKAAAAHGAHPQGRELLDKFLAEAQRGGITHLPVEGDACDGGGSNV